MTLIIINIAKLLKISPSLLLAICTTESNLRNVINYDDGGSPSYGVCQVKLNTARMFVPGIMPEHLMVPEMNIFVAGTYLKHQLKRYGYNSCHAISAYNMGTMRKFKSGKYKNNNYVRKVARKYGQTCN